MTVSHSSRQQRQRSLKGGSLTVTYCVCEILWLRQHAHPSSTQALSKSGQPGKLVRQRQKKAGWLGGGKVGQNKTNRSKRLAFSGRKNEPSNRNPITFNCVIKGSLYQTSLGGLGGRVAIYARNRLVGSFKLCSFGHSFFFWVLVLVLGLVANWLRY